MKTRIAHLKIIGALAALACVPSFGLQCQSIDVTFRPLYKVDVTYELPTDPARYGVEIDKTSDLAGQVVEHLAIEGTGEINEQEFHLDLVGDGVSGYLKGTRIQSSLYKAEMSLNGEKPQELSCNND